VSAESLERAGLAGMGAGLVALATGLWLLTPWLAMVVVGALLLAGGLALVARVNQGGDA
jgi:hypothetical protein